MDFGSIRKTLAFLALACLAGPALAQDAQDIEGRWKEIRAEGPDRFRIGTIEFTPCGENMCGLRIDAKGKCGAKFIEMHRAEARTYTGHAYPHYTGVGDWQKRHLDFYVWRHENGARMTASEGRSPFSRVLPVHMLENDFQRIGDAQCKPPVS